MKPNFKSKMPVQQASFYTVYDEGTGETVFSGSKRECADFMLSHLEETPEEEYTYGLLKDGKEEVSWDISMLSNWAKRPANLPPLSDITEEEYKSFMLPPDVQPERNKGKMVKKPVTILSS